MNLSAWMVKVIEKNWQGKSNMQREDGSIYYNCNICQDFGFVHPRKEDGKPDYSKVIPCQCRKQSENMKQSEPTEAYTHLVETPAQKKVFLEMFPSLFTISSTCKAVQMSRRNFYNWLQDDPEFARDFEDAKKMVIETLEQEVRRRAVEGVEKPVYQGGKLVGSVQEYSDILLMFYLKGLCPERYRDNYQVQVNAGQVEIKTIEIILDEGNGKPPAIEVQSVVPLLENQDNGAGNRQ